MANKKAHVYILNVSYAMSLYPDDAFTKASKTILKTLQNRALANRKTDLATVILCGTEETKNMLADDDQYGHVYCMTDALDKPDTSDPAGKKRLPYSDSDLIRTFANVTTTRDKDVNADVIDAVIVALKMISNTCKKLKYTKDITVFTHNQSPMDWSDLPTIAGMLREQETELTVVGVDFDEIASADCSEIVKTNYENWEELIKTGHAGSLISLREAYDIGKKNLAREVNPRPAYNGYLYIGSPHANKQCLGIYINTYLRTKDEKLPQSHSWSTHSHGPTHDVAKSSKFLLDVRDEESGETKEQEVPKEALRSGYKFGKSMLIVTEEEMSALKLETRKEMTVIGFVDATDFPRYYFYSNCYILTTGKLMEQESAKALNAFTQTLFVENLYALVRYVSKDGGQPKMGVLVPLMDQNADICVLQYLDVPFADDIRDYKFRTVAKSKASDGEGYDLMEAIVDSMSLDAKGDEYLEPEHTFNPLIWRLNTAIKNRHLNPGSSVPDFEERWLPQLEVSEDIKRKVDDLGEEAAKHFNVKQVVDKGKKRAYSHMDLDASQGESAAMEDILSTVVSDARRLPSMDTDLPPMINKKVKTIGLITPVDDFNAMINSMDDEEDMVEKAVKDMHNVIFKLLRSSFKNQHYVKVVDCLKAFRKAAAKEDEASSYNSTIKEVKTWCNISVKEENGEPNPRLELWEMIKSANLGLITNDECQDTDTRDVTKEVAEKFWQDEEKKSMDIDNDGWDDAEDDEDLF